MTEQCGNCKFGLERTETDVFCRVFPAQNIYVGMPGQHATAFPVMNKTGGWCGQWKAAPAEFKVVPMAPVAKASRAERRRK